ncbi:hypothetical protein [Thalassoroseus pseudoceratinae]|uniref:hypothetical protein n=1 Tax=Thalassoroseus pseudoceratinae TaxID=2713176 RepID=UPI00141E1CD2|nr:hypothetical protein [Thalassoroseus pseudoceratinae]
MSDMELVPLFGQMIRRDWADALTETQLETHYRDAEGQYRRIPFGEENFLNPRIAEAGPCRHCRTIKGKLHFHACDYEQCPKCNTQQMGCDCEFIGHEWREE